MKIAISSQEKDLTSEVDPRFGRCTYFVLYDSESGEHEVIENPGVNASSGAGIETARFIANLNVQAILTGNVGPNAYTTLDAADIEIYAGISGKISDAIEDFKNGNLKSTQAATVESHHGMTAVSNEKKGDEKIIAITAESDAGLDAPIGQHFGRCPFYTFVTIKDGKMASAKSVSNPFFNAHQPGQVPQFINEQNADVMITGGMGQRAVQIFNEFGIEAVTGANGNVRQTVEAYLNGSLAGSSSCSGHQHFGGAL